MNGRDISYLKSVMKTDCGGLSQSIGAFITELTDRLDREGVILGLSGGIDSAVVAALCSRAVGPEKVLALLMPEKDSETRHIADAWDLASELGIQAKKIDITPYLKKFGIWIISPAPNTDTAKNKGSADEEGI